MEAGPEVVVDIDNALCRESLQVIGALLRCNRHRQGLCNYSM